MCVVIIALFNGTVHIRTTHDRSCDFLSVSHMLFNCSVYICSDVTLIVMMLVLLGILLLHCLQHMVDTHVCVIWAPGVIRLVLVLNVL